MFIMLGALGFICTGGGLLILFSPRNGRNRRIRNNHIDNNNNFRKRKKKELFSKVKRDVNDKRYSSDSKEYNTGNTQRRHTIRNSDMTLRNPRTATNNTNSNSHNISTYKPTLKDKVSHIYNIGKLKGRSLKESVNYCSERTKDGISEFKDKSKPIIETVSTNAKPVVDKVVKTSKPLARKLGTEINKGVKSIIKDFGTMTSTTGDTKNTSEIVKKREFKECDSMCNNYTRYKKDDPDTVASMRIFKKEKREEFS